MFQPNVKQKWGSLSDKSKKSVLYGLVLLLGGFLGNGDRVYSLVYEYVVSPDQFATLEERVTTLENNVCKCQDEAEILEPEANSNELRIE